MALGLRVALNQKTQTSDLRPLSIMQTIKRELNEDGVLIEETWMCDGQIHRTDGPASLYWDADGTLRHEAWFLYGKAHRTDGPAKKTWRSTDGTLSAEMWFQNDQLHRTDAPAQKEWFPDGTLFYEAWFLHGKVHRTDGPAKKSWRRTDGTLADERWYLDGKETSHRVVILTRVRAKVLRSSHLLIFASAVQCVSTDSLSVIGGFM